MICGNVNKSGDEKHKQVFIVLFTIIGMVTLPFLERTDTEMKFQEVLILVLSLCPATSVMEQSGYGDKLSCRGNKVISKPLRFKTLHTVVVDSSIPTLLLHVGVLP